MPEPFISKRAPLYADVPDEKWNDWRWQLSNRLNSVDDIEKILPLTESERVALQTSGLFRVDITPYFISLVDPTDLEDPIRKQIIPRSEEMQAFTSMMEDSLAEDRHSPVPGLVHRYPDRVLMLVTTQCASYCRYCTRSRIVGNPHENFSKADSVSLDRSSYKTGSEVEPTGRTGNTTVDIIVSTSRHKPPAKVS